MRSHLQPVMDVGNRLAPRIAPRCFRSGDARRIARMETIGVIPKGFVPLSQTMFQMACDLAARCEGEPTVEQMKHSIACIVMCQTTLEAWLNEDLEKLRTLDNAKDEDKKRNWAAVIRAIKKAPIEAKWLAYPQLRWGKTYDATAEPFASFTHLVALRNELVHYAPSTKDMRDDFPRSKIRGLDSRFTFSEQYSSWTNQVLNAACARWACRTTMEMIREYCRFRGSSDLFADSTQIDPVTGATSTGSPLWPLPPADPPKARENE